MNIIERLAKIRPLMTQDDAAWVLGLEGTQYSKPTTPSHPSSIYINEYNFSLNIGIDQLAESVFYQNIPSGRFSPWTDNIIEGIYIGMSEREFLEKFPDSVPDKSEDYIKYNINAYKKGMTKSGFVVEARGRDQRILAFKLHRPDIYEIRALREQAGAKRVKAFQKQLELDDHRKTIADPNERLVDWAENCSPWNEGPERFIIFARWLMNEATPEGWHIAAQRWNWDYDIEPLLWIVRQPKCDLATAIHIFYAANPGYYCKFCGDRDKILSIHIDIYDFIIEIKTRLENGFYESNFEIDAERLFKINTRGVEKEEIDRLFPEIVRHKINGKAVVPGKYPDNIPSDIS